MITAKEKDIVISDNLRRIIEAGQRLFQPRPTISVSEWAEKNRFITREETNRPGMWDNKLVPFAVEPMNCYSDPEVEQMTYMGSAQVAKTEIIKNIIGYNAAQRGDPMQLIYNSDDDAREFSTEKLEPMIRSNDCISSKIASQKANSKDNKTLFKKFIEGGFLIISGSRAPQKLARRSLKDVLVDDADRVGNAGDEGDAVALLFERTETYALLGRFLGQFSTPTIEGASRIKKNYLEGDQREYYVPCPHCGHMQTLRFDQLKWKKESDMFGNTIKHYPDTVVYVCEECNADIDERYKDYMISEGVWIAKFPERKHHRSYWINRLYSPFSTWAMIVKKFLKTKDDHLEFRVFLNTYLAQTFKLEEAREINDDELLSRVEDYCTEDKPYVPNDVLTATMSADIQNDRIEVHIFGWGNGKEGWAVDHKKLYGDPLLDDVWNDFTDYWKDNLTIKREDGLEIPVRLIFIDSGGKEGVTERVYNYTKRYARLMAVKGQGGYDKPILLNVSKVGKNKDARLQNIGVDAVKTILYKNLYRMINKKIESGPGVLHFSSRFCDVEYFLQLTSEKAVVEYDKKNRRSIVWKKKVSGSANEVLDLWVYGYAAMLAMNPDWEQLKKNRDEQLEKLKDRREDGEENQEVKSAPKIVKVRRRSNFVNSWK